MALRSAFFKVNLAFRIGGRMYGVVLWNDHDQGRAVIWCEDHGNLAFFNGEHDTQPGHLPCGLEPGDLVQFDVNENKRMRFARNLSLVAPDEYPSLAEELREAGRATNGAVSPPCPEQSSNIIPFGSRPEVAAPVREPVLKSG